MPPPFELRSAVPVLIEEENRNAMAFFAHWLPIALKYTWRKEEKFESSVTFRKELCCQQSKDDL